MLLNESKFGSLLQFLHWFGNKLNSVSCKINIGKLIQRQSNFIYFNKIHKLIALSVMVIIIAPNSRARKGGEVKGEYGRIWGMVERNGATQSATCFTMFKKGWVGIEHERLENSASVLGRHLGGGYTGGRCNPTPSTRCHRDTLLVAHERL